MTTVNSGALWRRLRMAFLLPFFACSAATVNRTA